MKIQYTHPKSVEGQSYDLDAIGGPEISIGRQSDSIIQTPPTSGAVSKHHAVVRRGVEGKYEVIDAGSKNGTFINNEKVTGKQVLSPGERLRLGSGSNGVEFIVKEENEKIINNNHASNHVG